MRGVTVTPPSMLLPYFPSRIRIVSNSHTNTQPIPVIANKSLRQLAMAAQTAGVMRVMSSTALAQFSCSGAASASMSLTRGGLALRRTGSFSSWSLRLQRVPLVTAKPPLQRPYSATAPKVMVVASSSQWKSEAPGGFEVEIDSNNEFPRPSSVPWAKEMANTVHLIGNVGRDMEIKYLDTGKVVAKSSLAVSRNSVKKDEPPSWFEMEFWDSLAEIAGHHLKKGDQVYVTGRLMVDTFMKGEVNQRTARVVVNNVHFVESNRSATLGSGRGSSSAWTQSRPTQSQSSTGANRYAEANAETEKLWNAFFSDPDHWWDNRATKPSPKSPDFKHKTTNEALWIVSKRTPAWVPLQLQKLEAARQDFIASGGNPNSGRSQSRQSNTFSGADFKDF